MARGFGVTNAAKETVGGTLEADCLSGRLDEGINQGSGVSWDTVYGPNSSPISPQCGLDSELGEKRFEWNEK